jgi:septation ring formation regulator EzrA
LSYNLSLQGKAQEKIKSAEDRVRQIEQKMEADKICYSEAIAKELAKVHHHHHHSTHSKLLACISPQVLELVLW